MWIIDIALWHSVMAFALALSAILIALARKSRPFVIYAVAFCFLALSFFFLILRTNRNIMNYLASLSLAASYCVFAWGIRAFDGKRNAWPFRFWVYLSCYAALQFAATYFTVLPYLRAIIASVFAIVLSLECVIALATGAEWLPKGTRVKIYPVFAFIIAYRLVLFAMNALNLAAFRAPFGDGFLSGGAIILSIASSTLLMAVIVILDTAQLLHQMEGKNAALEILALKDELTGLLNRHTLEGAVAAESQRQDRYRAPLALVMVDIDHFKDVNDTYGHDIGDRVLVEVARRIKANLRDTDLLFRWGGEELLVLAPETGLAGATSLAEKLRRSLFESEIEPAGIITASFGVVERLPGEAREICFKRVDQAMYRAKTGGRNRVETWKPEALTNAAAVRIDWRAEWESGNSVIDDGHRDLIEKGSTILSLSLEQVPRERLLGLMDDLIADIQRHFAEEEEILGRVSYPDLEEHKAIHAALFAEACATRAAYAGNMGDPTQLFHLIVEKILLEHMITIDSKFFPYLVRA